MNRKRSDSLRRQLLSIGQSAGRHAEAGGVRFVALLVATLVVTLGLSSLMVVHAAYAGKESRRTARTPVSQDRQSGRKNSTLWLVGSDVLEGERRFSVVSIAPRNGEAPLPPGVKHWPGPGEVLLSPALQKAGAGEGIDQRYGKLVDTIGQEGLEDPGEWLAYVRPRSGLNPEQPVETVVGFGPAAGPISRGLEPGSGKYDDKPEWLFLSLGIGTLLLPAAALVAVAARAGAHARDRRTALVAVLGGRRADRAVIAVGEAWRPVVLGAVAAVPLVAVALLTDLRVPYADYIVSSDDMRQQGWRWALTPVVAIAAVLAAVVLTDQVPRRRGDGRATGADRHRWLPRVATLCPFMILLAVRGPALAGSGAAPRMITSWIGIAGTVLTLPAAVAVGVAMLGRRLERGARARGRAGVLIASRRAGAYPGSTVRLVTGISVALIVFMQAVAWQALFGAQSAELEAALGRIDKSMVEVGPKGAATVDEMASFLQRLPDSETVLLTNSGEGAGRSMGLQGSCPALKALHLRCPEVSSRLDRMPEDSRLQELIRWNSRGGAHLEVSLTDRTTLAKRAVAGGEDAVLAVVAHEGTNLSVPALKQLSYQVFPRGAQVRAPGEEWLTATIPNRDQGRWIALLGLVGIGVLTMAAGLSAMAEFLRHGRSLAPLSVLTGGFAVYRSSAGWSVMVPLALSGVGGGVVAAWLARPVSRPGGSYYISLDLWVTTVMVVVGVALAMWLWSAAVAVRQARGWRPRGD
ncbi:ABC transporter permease [Streptomyces sp. NBC_00151]|uniref:ABC transporter permease n=1 Tax=Streptomyces sp. NBC_00151 TaxID=2975669 RepID=UPI002DDC82D1|nr:ABC transporter permease [Streptomyces sp. NBC_00151]WRZ42816.1 ABC transporter permease [Streptomyces sp. NBC_00151]